MSDFKKIIFQFKKGQNPVKIVVGICLGLFIYWVWFLYFNWSSFHNLRQLDPLWEIKIAFPHLYIIIGLSLILSWWVIWHDIGSNKLHLMLLMQIALIVLATPYLICGLTRFPDTFGVVSNVEVLPEILQGKVSSNYPKSFPGSYMLFYVLYRITDINLFTFARLYSPFIIMLSLVLWYLIIVKISDFKSALIGLILLIPSLIIEVSITPNSIGFILVLTVLLTLCRKTISFRIIGFLALLALIFTHVINGLIFIVILTLLYLFSYYFNKDTIALPLSSIILPVVIWFAHLVFTASAMGEGIIKGLYNILTLKSISAQQMVTYTAGTGDLTLPWIQQLHFSKYVLLLIIAVSFFRYLLNSKNILQSSVELICFLVASILLVLSVFVLLLVGSDAENLVSRVLNYAMLFLTAFIGMVVIQIQNWNISVTRFKITNGLIIILTVCVLAIYVTYPVYAYARESYISFPLSDGYGRAFVKENATIGSDCFTIIGGSEQSFSKMRTNKVISFEEELGKNKIYSNNTFDIYRKDFL